MTNPSSRGAAAIAPVASPARVARAAEPGVDMAGIDTALAVLATEVPHQQLREAVASTSGTWIPTAPSRTPPRAGR